MQINTERYGHMQTLDTNVPILNDNPIQSCSTSPFIPRLTQPGQLKRKSLQEFRSLSRIKLISLKSVLWTCQTLALTGQQPLASTLAKTALQFSNSYPVIAEQNQTVFTELQAFVNETAEDPLQTIDTLLNAHKEKDLLRDRLFILLPLLLQINPSEALLNIIKKYPDLLPYGKPLSAVQAHYCLLTDTIQSLLIARGFDESAIQTVLSGVDPLTIKDSLVLYMEEVFCKFPKSCEYKTNFEKDICTLGYWAPLYKEFYQAHSSEKERATISHIWTKTSPNQAHIERRIDDPEIRQRVETYQTYLFVVAHLLCTPGLGLNSLLVEHPDWAGLEAECTPDELSSISPAKYRKLMDDETRVPQLSALINSGLGKYINEVKCTTYDERIRRRHLLKQMTEAEDSTRANE